MVYLPNSFFSGRFSFLCCFSFFSVGKTSQIIFLKMPCKKRSWIDWTRSLNGTPLRSPLWSFFSTDLKTPLESFQTQKIWHTLSLEKHFFTLSNGGKEKLKLSNPEPLSTIEEEKDERSGSLLISEYWGATVFKCDKTKT